MTCYIKLKNLIKRRDEHGAKSQKRNNKSGKKNVRKIENGKAADNSRLTYISMMNVIAAISVVILHANVGFWLDYRKPFWDTANVIECIFYFAVPVFYNFFIRHPPFNEQYTVTVSEIPARKNKTF